MLFEGKNLSFTYKDGNSVLDNMNLTVKDGERVGIVAKSGFGKSTLAKILAGYLKASKGEVLLNGKEISNKGYNPIQLIHQHPEKSVNPRWKMKKVIEESGHIDYDLIEKMGIKREWLTRYSRELSGGELQRFCIARALNKKTKVLIADEITTMLDVITQAQIWEMLLEYINKNKITLIVITHNMDLARRVCSRIINLDKNEV